MFEKVKKDAEKLNIPVVGSEIVSVVPLKAILMAADYYIEKENLFILDEDQKVRLVIERLGLKSVAPFNPKEKIIEYIIAEESNEPLAGLTVRQFIKEVASRSSAPGSGSASAAIAAIGAGLGSMVAQLTLGVRKFETLDGKMRKLIPPLFQAADSLTAMIDADTDVFNNYVDALRLPETNDDEKKVKQEKMQLGLKDAIDIPLTTMRLTDAAWDAMVEVARYGNIASKSDIEVGAKSMETGIWGAYKNVMINMADITAAKFKSNTIKEAEAIKTRAEHQCKNVLRLLANR